MAADHLRRRPGSQLALTAARLGDGTWLLAWSAFDGHADEIVWSRQSPGAPDGAWSAPLRVAAKNDVPDITPALTPLADGGALLAWSRFDGEAYRVMTARFADGKWTAPRFAGPSGSLFPSFAAATSGISARSATAATGGKWLLYQNAAPQGWSVAEIDAAGRATRTAFLATARADRPMVSPATDRSGVAFHWPASGAREAAGEEENRAATWERP